MRIAFALLFFFPVSLLADRSLPISACHTCEYGLRWNPQADSVEFSSHPQWDPWLPEDVFGWQILNPTQLEEMFLCPTAFVESIDFHKHLVLAVIRHDSVKWRFFPQKATFSGSDATLLIEYEATTQTLRPSSPVISTSIFLIEIPEKMRQIGTTNLHFAIQESQRGPWRAGESPYSAPQAEFWFPVAYTQRELEHSFRLRQSLLQELSEEVDGTAIWIPDYALLHDLFFQPGQVISPLHYRLIEDSVSWAQSFRPMWGRRIQEQWGPTTSDLEKTFALAIPSSSAHLELVLDRMYWTSQGLRIDVSSRVKEEERATPSIFVMMLSKGNYGRISVWKDGRELMREHDNGSQSHP